MATSVKRPGFDRAAIGFAIRMAFAAWLAFTVAAALQIPNPFWAAMPIWVVAQPTRGLLFERAFFRIVGTLLGGAAGFGILFATGNPFVQLLLLGLWVAGCAGLTHVLRGVHSYGALLSGITAAVVILPSALGHNEPLTIAVARVECTLIGVVTVTLVTGLFTPRSERAAFYERVRQLAGDAVAFVAGLASGEPGRGTEAEERHILSEIGDVDSRALLTSAGSADGYRRLNHVTALITASLSVMAAGRALQSRHGAAKPSSLAGHLDALAEELRAAEPARSAWPELRSLAIHGPVGDRLRDGLSQLVSAEAALFAEPNSAYAHSFGRKATYVAPDRDWARAVRSGTLIGAATFLAALAAYLSGWAAGELAALGVCIFGMVLGSMAVPRLIAPKLFAGVVSGVFLAILYRFFVQPHLDGLLALSLSVIPFILIGAFARAHPRTAIAGIDTNMCFLLASQAGMPAATSASEIWSGAAALVAGGGIIVAAIMAMPHDPMGKARQSARHIRRDIERLLARPVENWHPRAARQILRLVLHLRRAGTAGSGAPRGLLAALNLGHAISELQGIAGRADADPDAHGLQALQTLRGFADRPVEVADALMVAAETAGDAATSLAMRDAAMALRDAADLFLFPESGHYRRARRSGGAASRP